MPADLFIYWQAYFGLEPFAQSDRLLATVACRVYNATRSDDSPVLSINDFLPVSQTEEREQLDALEKRLAEMKAKNAKSGN